MKTKSGLYRFALCAAVTIGLLASTGCGGGSSSTPPPVVAISVSPSSGIWVLQSGTQPFTATVTGTTNTAVNWSVKEGAAGGSITNLGVYTAPNKAGTFHIVATSQADTTKSATAVLAVPPISVSLNPSTATIDIDEQFAFVASVGGTINPASQAVTWTIQEASFGGSITASGVYTAPGTYGTYHVIATSQLDTTQTATAIVTVAPVSVSISPSTDMLGPAGVRMFGATVTTSLNTNVTWSVQEGTAGGAITTGGQYTAPTSPGGVFHVVATSVQDPTKSATADVTIVPSGFRPTGDMNVARAGAAGVLLQNGKVLIAGGRTVAYRGTSKSSSAELYDPTSGTFATTGNMSVGRIGPTATLLTNGKVLVTGGHSDASAELYDPAAGTFTTTGNMTMTRADAYSATLLQSGKVLVAGGEDLAGNSLAQAELYDPNSGTFISTGSMATARSWHTATLLANGKVLIAGGCRCYPPASSVVLGTAELYDPVSGNFSPAGSMTTPRMSHAATLLATGNVLMTGGGNNGGLFRSTETYDTTTGSFSATTNMVFPHADHWAKLLPNGTVLVAGDWSYLAEVYDPIAGVFTQTGGMGAIRGAGAPAVLLLDGRVLVSGGGLGNPSIYPVRSSAEVYK